MTLRRAMEALQDCGHHVAKTSQRLPASDRILSQNRSEQVSSLDQS
jgi:hypothetical protein